jgi:hypothetical protein
MKKYVIIHLLNNCQVTETIHLNQDGTGKLKVVNFVRRTSYMQLMGEK